MCIYIYIYTYTCDSKYMCHDSISCDCMFATAPGVGRKENCCYQAWLQIQFKLENGHAFFP